MMNGRRETLKANKLTRGNVSGGRKKEAVRWGMQARGKGQGAGSAARGHTEAEGRGGRALEHMGCKRDQPVSLCEVAPENVTHYLPCP